MGLFDIFRRRKSIDPGLRRAVEDYRRELAEGAEEATKAVDTIFGGLSERDVSMLMAAAAGLIQTPVHLVGRLDLYAARKEHLRRRESETEAYTYFGLAGVDALDAALDLLLLQAWWPEFIAGIREQFGITTAADVGRWGQHGKRVAPYVGDCGYLFQTPEAIERMVRSPRGPGALTFAGAPLNRYSFRGYGTSYPRAVNLLDDIDGPRSVGRREA